MSKVSPLVDGLIEAMQCLPGVGPKSAQRMVLHLLERNRDGGIMLADIMAKACLLYTSPSPRDRTRSRMPSSA